MKNKLPFRAALTLVLAAGALAALPLLHSVNTEHARLTAELQALPLTVSASLALPALPPGQSARTPFKTLAAADPSAARKEITRRLLRGNGRKYTDPVKKLLEPLSAEELEKLIDINSPADFASFYTSISGPEGGEENAAALGRMLALQRLFVIAPEKAFPLLNPPNPPDSPERLYEMVTLGLEQWVPQDPAAALRWTRDHAAWLPADNRFPLLVLGLLAKTDMPQACGLAKEQGMNLSEILPGLASSARSRKDADILMEQLTAAPAASPESFSESLRKTGGDLTGRVGTSLGFEAARQFAEKWAATLPGREDIALTAVKTALARRPDPKAEAAADWMMHFVPEDRRTAAVENLVNAWADEDFSAPAAWLQKTGNVSWRDAGLAALCRKIAPFDSDAAAQYAASISDDTLRAQALSSPGAIP